MVAAKTNPLDGVHVDVNITGNVILDDIIITHDDFMMLSAAIQKLLIEKGMVINGNK